MVISPHVQSIFRLFFYQPTISQDDIVLKDKDIEGLGFQSVLVEHR